jgi:hypothetical protein
MGLGMIHELANAEIRIRRELQAAEREVDCALRMIVDDTAIDPDLRSQLEVILNRASRAIWKVTGA